MNDQVVGTLPGTGKTTSGEAGMLDLLGVARVLQERVEAALDSVGLSGPKYMVLEQLVRSDDPLPLSVLAEHQKCVRSNITQLVDRLEADGLARRVDDPSDRRAVRAVATPMGKKRFAAGTEAVRSVQAELMSGVSDVDQKHFLRILSAFRKC